jgi:preprotein translocase subunit SecG
MKIFLLVISILLITIVLLQSNKAESASQIISGGNSDLFSKRKERGLELFISRLTLALGMVFFLVSLIAEFV